MNKKIAIVLIALVGVGLYALPQTMALFSGQHDFVNIDPTGNQIECVKCHGDVQAEIAGSGTNLQTGTPAPHAAFKCEYCHRIEAGAASGDNAYAAITYASGAMKRTMVITLMDFEEENFPGSPKYPGEGIINNVLDKAAAQSGGVRPTQGYNLSPIVGGTEGDSTLLLLSNEYEQPTYNKTTGQPFDTSARKSMGLNLAQLNQNNNTGNWTLGSRYWTTGLYGAGSRVVNPGSEYHAASLVSCLECHGGFEPFGHYSRVMDDEAGYANNDAKCGVCHYGYTPNRWTELSAGGFGITGGADTGAQEAHMEFQTTDDGLTEYKAVGTASYSNGACISCHTHVAVDITYTKPDTLKFDVNFATGTATEELSGQVATGTVITNSS